MHVNAKYTDKHVTTVCLQGSAHRGIIKILKKIKMNMYKNVLWGTNVYLQPELQL